MKRFMLVLGILLVSLAGYAQKVTRVFGQVIDATNGERMPFVGVVYQGKNIGTLTDDEGRFNLETKWAGETVEISSMGYQTQTFKIRPESNNNLGTVRLKPDSYKLTGAVVRPKRVPYRRKGNPAVELMKRVIENRDTVGKDGRDYYQYDMYENLEISVNNVSGALKDKPAWKNYQFVYNYVDTSEFSGKPFLPFFMKESVTECYYRKNPEVRKEIVRASEMSGFKDALDAEGISSFMDILFCHIDIYQDEIVLLDKRFVSPLAGIATGFYKYFIKDTVEIGGVKCVELTYLPQNSNDWGFSGKLFVNPVDASVCRAELGLMKNSAINFVSGMKLTQSFDVVDSTYVLTEDEIVLDFTLFEGGQGFYGRHKSKNTNFVFDKPRPAKDYEGNTVKTLDIDAHYRDEAYWARNRSIPKTDTQVKMGSMLDTLHQVPSFKFMMKAIDAFSTGYVPTKNFDIGPFDSFYHYNAVEGSRFRLGLRTTAKFNRNLFLEGFVAYGFKDKVWKYQGQATYSFNKKDKHYFEYPQNYLAVSYEYDTQIPGRVLQYTLKDNTFDSFAVNGMDMMTYDRKFDLQYNLEIENGLAFRFDFSHLRQTAGGNLKFQNAYGPIDEITNAQFMARVRFAPNEQFYQNKRNRHSMSKNQPVFVLDNYFAAKGVMGSQYTYLKSEFSVTKRFWFSGFGYLNSQFKAGAVLGQAPWLYLFVHNGNQTLHQVDIAYNMMNSLEFVSDRYMSLDLCYNAQGNFLGKVPLIKRLKLREVFTYKMVWGDLSEKNRPENNPGLLMFPQTEDGTPAMFYDLSKEPYMEAAIGLDNIFKCIRLDWVWRLSHNDNPNLSRFGLKAKLTFTF